RRDEGGEAGDGERQERRPAEERPGGGVPEPLDVRGDPGREVLELEPGHDRGEDEGRDAEPRRRREQAVEEELRAADDEGEPGGEEERAGERRHAARVLSASVPLASVYPLISARALARPFTYEVPPGVGKGAVVSVPFGRSSRRGVVVGLEPEAPAGVEPLPVGRVMDELPPALVDLALWVADYYGSTPARALELVAPRRPARRKEQPEPAELTASQRAAVARVAAGIDEGGGLFLLHGPTGSGKTEVYLQACGAALERGRGALVLVPEIALTPQTLGRFRARFGDRIAVLHSGLTEAERRDERERIASGEARVVVGARSAIFAPLHGLGLVCVDEEHDASYKQESDPRYDARAVA